MSITEEGNQPGTWWKKLSLISSPGSSESSRTEKKEDWDIDEIEKNPLKAVRGPWPEEGMTSANPAGFPLIGRHHQSAFQYKGHWH